MNVLDFLKTHNRSDAHMKIVKINDIEEIDTDDSDVNELDAYILVLDDNNDFILSEDGEDHTLYLEESELEFIEIIDDVRQKTKDEEFLDSLL